MYNWNGKEILIVWLKKFWLVYISYIVQFLKKKEVKRNLLGYPKPTILKASFASKTGCKVYL